MNEEAVKELVRRRLKSLSGVVDVRYLEDEMRNKIRHLEVIAESHGAIGGLMKFKNKGVWEVLDREVCLVMVLNEDYQINADTNSMIHIVDQSGQVLGEYVSPERREEIRREAPDTFFLTEDFIMHSGWKSVGEPYFLIDEVIVHDLDDIDEIERVTSGSLTAKSDEVIRDIFGFTAPDQYSRLIGFDFRE
ncbi:MAG: hypothetical protein SA339_04180 [Methanomassiliicoccus sp.]|nr:hypothetical protein [Methanomassiliicoccus sp.]